MEIDDYIFWVNEDPNRVLVVPGSKMASKLYKDGMVELDQILDMYSLKMLYYPDLATREVAFYDWKTCMQDCLVNRLGKIVDLGEDEYIN